MNYFQIYKEEKLRYLDNLKDARDRGLMTQEEYDKAFEKLDIRVTRMVVERINGND